MKKGGDRASEEALVTLLTDSYLSNGRIAQCICITGICEGEQVVDFITWRMMKLYPPLRVFFMEFDEQIRAGDNKP